MLRRRTCSHQLFNLFPLQINWGNWDFQQIVLNALWVVCIPSVPLTVWWADSRSCIWCCWALTPKGASSTSDVFSYYFQVKESPSGPCRLKSFRSPKDWMDLTWCFKIFWQNSERKPTTSATARFKGSVSRTGHLSCFCHLFLTIKSKSK